MSDFVLNQLRLLASGLSVGASSNGETCPFCNGGRGRERSLSLKRVDETRVLYRCFRATCGRFGSLTGTSYTSSNPSNLRVKSRNVFSSDTRELGERWISELSSRFGFPRSYTGGLGWKETVDDGRLVVPICSPDGVERGIETRSSNLYMGSAPKTLHYRESDDPWMGWYGVAAAKSRGIVLVEDVISAAKVALAGFAAASLMGSHVSLDHALEAAEVGDAVSLALDRDATYKAIGFRKRFAALLDLKVIPLQRDLKYESPEDIVSIVTK